MAAARNLESVRAMLAGVSADDFDAFTGRLAPDEVYEAPYYRDFGERVGRDAVAEMFAGLTARFSCVNYWITGHFPTVDPGLVIVECRGDDVVTGTDRHYRNHYLMFVSFSPVGQVVRWREFSNPDTYRREADGEDTD
jgi:ketosteroid isomerase-like protein